MNFRICWTLLQSQALLLTAILCVILTGFELQKSLWTSPGYVLVVDCGSTGTRLHAYQWQDKPNRLPLLRPMSIRAAKHKVPRRSGGKRAYERIETEPGMDSFLHDLPGVKNKALGPLLDWAAAVVPPHLQAATPIFLLGTAGLRKVAAEPRQKLLAEAQSALAASPFRFQEEWAEVITGEQEGLYGWIALNYLTGRLRAHPLAPAANETLDQPHPSAPSAPHDGPGSRKGPAGALDLGGSSLEITYPAQEDQEDLLGAQANLSIMGVPYVLTTHAFPGLGLNDAFAASVAQLLAAQGTQQQDGKLDAEGKLHDGPGQAMEAPTLLDTTPRRRIARHALTLHQGDSTNALQHAGHSGEASRHLLMDGPPISSDRQPLMALEQPGLVQVSWHSVPFPGQPMQPIPQLQLSDLSSTTNQGPRHGSWSNPASDGADSTSRKILEADSSKHAEPCSGGLLANQPRTDEMLASRGRRILQDDAKTGREHLPLVREAAEEAEAELEHPCLQQGFSRPYALRLKGPALPSLITLVGRPDWEACERLAASVVDASPLCPDGTCILADTISQQKADFYALTGFYVVYHFLRLPSTASLDQLLQAGRRYCQDPWDSLPAARRQEIHAETYCFRAPFVADLLQRGLGLQTPRVRIGTGSEAWTLGAALAQGSAARLADPVVDAAFRPPAPTWVQAAWGLLLAGCLLWLACLIWKRICIGMGRPPAPFDGLQAARRVGVDRLMDALPVPAGRHRSLQLGSIHEDQHLYHTGGTARVGSMPLPAIGAINTGGSHLQAPASPSSPGRSGFFWSPSTRAIGGSFNSNMHWLNSQRKRNMSQDNLEQHGAEL